MTFSELNLDPSIIQTLDTEGFTIPTPIQSQAIPKILAGFDIRASAQTGTGKTAAFMLPILNKLLIPSKYPSNKGPRILILVPTRELAMQVADEAMRFSRNLRKVKTVCIYGGAPYPKQNQELARPYEILVATPGRLIDHMQQGRVCFNRLEVMVLDEADRMLDMGFIEPVEKIASSTPKNRQTLLFSATMKGAVLGLSNRLLTNPIEISVSPENTRHENIEQRLHIVDDMHHKNRILNHLLSDAEINQVIIFTGTKRFADQLVDILFDGGHRAAALHGDMNQRQRTRTITRLRDGEVKILVATDVAARGIDVQTISHVINFDLPNNAEDYVHRIGRTGRAGAKGIAISFAASKDLGLVRQIEQYSGYKIVPSVIEGMEPSAKSSIYQKERKRGPYNSQNRRNRSQGPRSEFSPRRENSNDFSPRQRNENSNGNENASRPPRNSEFTPRPRKENFNGEYAPRPPRNSEFTPRPRKESSNGEYAPRSPRNSEFTPRPRKESSNGEYAPRSPRNGEFNPRARKESSNGEFAPRPRKEHFNSEYAPRSQSEHSKKEYFGPRTRNDQKNPRPARSGPRQNKAPMHTHTPV